MEFGNEVVEMQDIVKKEWRCHTRQFLGTREWIIESLIDMSRILLVLVSLTLVGGYVMLVEMGHEKYFEYFVMVIIAISGLYIVRRLYLIIVSMREYRLHRSDMNKAISQSFDEMMVAKYDWYNLNKIN